MEKGLVILIIVELVLALGLGYTLGFDAGTSEENVYCTNTTKTIIQYVRPEYEELMLEVSKREYELDVYDCSDMSIDLADMLTEIGYDARVECGWNTKDAGHAWTVVKLYLDPSKLTIHKQKPEYKKYSYSMETCDT